MLLLLGDQDELARLLVAAQQESRLTEDRHVERLEAEELAVEVTQLLAMLRQSSFGEGELHVVEAESGHGGISKASGPQPITRF